MRCFASCSIHIGTFNENRAGLSSQLYFFVLRLENMIGKYHGYDTKEIELLNQTGSLDKSLEVHQSLNSNSIEEMLNPKTATPIEGRLQPLNSNSISLAKLLKEICVRT